MVKGISTSIVRNNRFLLAVSIVYRPNRHALFLSIAICFNDRFGSVGAFKLYLILQVNTILAAQ